MTQRVDRQTRRKLRTRNNIRNLNRPRLSIYRSNKHIFAQIIDDKIGKTLAFAFGDKNTSAAKEIGKKVAEMALKKGIKLVVFDRGQYKYHGKIKALAESAREGGLSF